MTQSDDNMPPLPPSLGPAPGPERFGTILDRLYRKDSPFGLQEYHKLISDFRAATGYGLQDGKTIVDAYLLKMGRPVISYRPISGRRLAVLSVFMAVCLFVFFPSRDLLPTHTVGNAALPLAYLLEVITVVSIVAVIYLSVTTPNED